MDIQEDGTVDHTGQTPAELRGLLIARNGDIGDIWDGDPMELLTYKASES